MKGVTRSVNMVYSLAAIIVDYKYSFWKVDPQSDDYERVYHETNLRCANRALKLCRHLGGYYVKFGQMVSSLYAGVPREWTTTLAACQVWFPCCREE